MKRLEDDWRIRPATSSDAWPIRRLVLSAWLDPTQIRWQQFWVIETQMESPSSAPPSIIGCGQLRNFDDAQELGSLVIHPHWRHQGLGTALTHHLIQQADQPLYLECLGDRLLQFYTRLGFTPANWDTMPSSMKRKFQTTRTLARFLPIPLHVLETLKSTLHDDL
ncbi:MAG: GNAT family N-acetyltransferase [Leptolyngbyaceae bacterium]|nr:GNAT family N-acetyltransferase [Leptolyngbyaceae bacterium]